MYSDYVVGLVLDSPALDFGAIPDTRRELRLPRILTTTSKALAALRFRLDDRALDCIPLRLP